MTLQAEHLSMKGSQPICPWHVWASNRTHPRGQRRPKDLGLRRGRDRMDLELESRRPLEGVFGHASDGRPAQTSNSRSGVRVSGQSRYGTRMEDPD